MNSFWAEKPVFVTGATGLLGGWLVKRLLAEGADVVCLVRDSVPHSEIERSGTLTRVKSVRGDIGDRALLQRILGEYEIESVIHLAAQTIVGTANGNPVATFEANIAGTWNVLEACRQSPQIRSVLIASSDKAYGAQEKLPYTENTPLQGQHPYDVSKSCADLIAQSYAHTYGLPVVITRCGNFFGGGDLNWNRIVPGTIRSLHRGQAPIIRSDGLFERDYIYVEDGVEAYLRLAEGLESDSALLRGRAFNLSNGVPLTVLELVETIAQLMKCELKPVVQGQASNEIRRQYLSNQLAHDLLNWSPRHSLEAGLIRTIGWYREFLAA